MERYSQAELPFEPVDVNNNVRLSDAYRRGHERAVEDLNKPDNQQLPPPRKSILGTRADIDASEVELENNLEQIGKIRRNLGKISIKDQLKE